MDLRPALLPPTHGRLQEVTASIDEALARLSTDEPADVASHLSRRIGIKVSAEDVDAWHLNQDAEEIAAMLLRPPAHVLRGLNATDHELVELARRFMGLAGEEHLDHAAWYMAVFDANVPHPSGSTLAFHPPEGEDDPSPEQIVKWATSYRPIQL